MIPARAWSFPRIRWREKIRLCAGNRPVGGGVLSGGEKSKSLLMLALRNKR
jgi:hypothetical protein